VARGWKMLLPASTAASTSASTSSAGGSAVEQ
jgi:hypothetical protein